MPAIAFDPAPRIERIALTEAQSCYVIDDTLREPERLVELRWRGAPRSTVWTTTPIPGSCYRPPGTIANALNDFRRAYPAAL